MIHERKVVVVLDSCATEHAQLNSFLDVAVAATKEQLCRVESFNLIRCCSGVEAWSSGLREVSEDSISSAVQWLQDTKPQTVPFKTNVVEGVVKALAHSNTEGVYLLAQGDCTLRAFDLLLEKVCQLANQIHIVIFLLLSGESFPHPRALGGVRLQDAAGTRAVQAAGKCLFSKAGPPHPQPHPHPHPSLSLCIMLQVSQVHPSPCAQSGGEDEPSPLLLLQPLLSRQPLPSPAHSQTTEWEEHVLHYQATPTDSR